jgi:hypothetical protein
VQPGTPGRRLEREREREREKEREREEREIFVRNYP